MYWLAGAGIALFTVSFLGGYFALRVRDAVTPKRVTLLYGSTAVVFLLPPALALTWGDATAWAILPAAFWFAAIGVMFARFKTAS